jgi:ribosomal protein S18 acetylase RimI-like enzyme
VRLRRASPADAEGIARLVDDAYRPYVERIGMLPGPMTDDHAEVIRERQVTVAERGETLVGVLVAGADPDGFFIHNVAVHPDHQGTGVGRRLLGLAEEQAREAGFDEIRLYTHERLTESRALYERIGYAEYERRPLEGFSLVFLRKGLAA